MEEIEKPYMTALEASKYLGLHPVTIRHLAKRGKIPCRKFGVTYRIPTDFVFQKAECLKPEGKEGKKIE